jgi:O-antigen/teichoic acid export membrane protein
MHDASINIKKRLLSGGTWAFSGKILIAFSGLAVNALLARLLPPDEMGAYFLTLSMVSIFATVAQLGLTRTIVRLVAESMGTDRPARARMAVRLTIRLAGLGALVMACVLAFGGGAWVAERLFHSTLMSQVVGLAAVWMILIAFQQLIAEIYRGFHDIRLATIFGGLVTGLLAMIMFLGLWLLQGHSDLSQVILITLVAGFSSVALSSLFLWKKLRVLPLPAGDEIGASHIICISWSLWITTLTRFALHQTDLWIMGLFRSPEEVAVYGAVVRIVTLVTMPLLIVNAVVPPLIAEMHSQGKTKELEKALRTVVTLAGLPSLIVLGLFVFFGNFILGLFFGEYYRVGGVMLVVLSVGRLASVWAGSCGQTLMLTGHQMTMMVITIASGLSMIIGAWLLVEAYGGIGVASAAAAGIIIQNALMVLYAKKKVGVWTHVDINILVRSMKK